MRLEFGFPAFESLATLHKGQSKTLNALGKDLPINTVDNTHKVNKVVQLLQTWFLFHSTMKGYYNVIQPNYSWGQKFSEADLNSTDKEKVARSDKGKNISLNDRFAEVRPFFRAVLQHYDFTPSQIEALCGDKQLETEGKAHDVLMRDFPGMLAQRVGSDKAILKMLTQHFHSGGTTKKGWKLFGGAKPSTPDKKDTPQGGTGSSGALAS